jgi:hypothetical protein
MENAIKFRLARKRDGTYTVKITDERLGELLNKVSNLSGSPRRVIERALLIHTVRTLRTQGRTIEPYAIIECTINDTGRLTRSIMKVVRLENCRTPIK